MNSENENMAQLARMIAAEIARNQGALMTVTTNQSLPACGTLMPSNGCENLLYAQITTFRFLRSGRTDIDKTIEGTIPVVPGASVLLSQDSRPPWPTGCYSLRYRLANNGNNHDEIQIEWFLDDEAARHQALRQRDLQLRRHGDRRRPPAGPAGDGPALLRRRQQPPEGPHPPPRQQQPDREHPPVRPPRQGHHLLLVVRDGPVVRLRQARRVTSGIKPRGSKL
jgi:hypothetical protein